MYSSNVAASLIVSPLLLLHHGCPDFVFVFVPDSLVQPFSTVVCHNIVPIMYHVFLLVSLLWAPFHIFFPPIHPANLSVFWLSSERGSFMSLPPCPSLPWRGQGCRCRSHLQCKTSGIAPTLTSALVLTPAQLHLFILSSASRKKNLSGYSAQASRHLE